MRKFEAPVPIPDIVAQLRSRREQWRRQGALLCRPLAPVAIDRPSRKAIAGIVEQLRGALFPQRLGPPDLRSDLEDFFVGHTLAGALDDLALQIQLELRQQSRNDPKARAAAIEAHALTLTARFGGALPVIRAQLDADILAAHRRDRAGPDIADILRHHPGILAMVHYRLAHQLHRLGLDGIARLISDLAQAATGVAIHPGAIIGPGVSIQQGTDVRIDEHARIGADCTLTGNLHLGETVAAGTHLNVPPIDASRRGSAVAGPSAPISAAAPDDVAERFGATIRQQREQRGWSQEQLAWRAELNRSYLGEIERSAAMPSIASASKLAHALSLPLSTLIAQCEGRAAEVPGIAGADSDYDASVMAIGG